ncbi:RNA pseudouridine synthase 3 mitochondrial, partial [Bienertia sinuspersici]
CPIHSPAWWYILDGLGRTKEITSYLQQLFTYMNVAKTSCLVLCRSRKSNSGYLGQWQAWNDACETTSMKHWAFGHWVLLDDGKTERVMLTHPSGVEASQEAMTEYWVLGPMINGCSCIELRPLTSRKH